MQRLTAWIGRTLTGLGTYSVLAGLGLLPLPAALAAIAVGAVAGQLPLALGIVLILSLVANGLLVAALLRRRPSRRRSKPERPSALAKPTELDSLTTTSADLEAWWANMTRVIAERVGPDAYAYVEAIHLGPSPFIVFYGQSAAAMKGFGGTVGGTQPSDVNFYGIYKVEALWERPIRPPLWRSDDSWLNLVRLAWVRERPGDPHCVLYQGIDGTTRFWRVSFAQYLTSDDRLIPGREYTLDTAGHVQARRS